MYRKWFLIATLIVSAVMSVQTQQRKAQSATSPLGSPRALRRLMLSLQQKKYSHNW